MEKARKRRRKTVKNVQETVNEKFEDLKGVWKDVLGKPEKFGFWIVSGKEKHGKSWLNLMLADMLKDHEPTLYISGEEGFSEHFKGIMNRLRIDHNSKNLYFEDEVMTLSQIEEEFESKNEQGKMVARRNAIQIVIIDNLTVFSDVLRKATIDKMFKKWGKKKLFIFVAHEEGGELVGAVAKQVRRLATIIWHVEGLNVNVSGRCIGGNIAIDDEKASLYHGQSILN